jgi:hypothetical protein
VSDIAVLAGGLWPYLIVVVVGFLPSEMWRMLGTLLSRGLDENSEIIVWVRFVATTLLAGVVAKLLFAPTGALASVPAYGRFGSLLVGLGAYFLLGRSVIVGVLLGEVALIAITGVALP